VDPDDANRIFANNYGGGNFLSEDGGVTWVNASDGYTGAQVRSIAVSPGEPGQVFAAARSGIFGSDDGGGKWIGLNFSQAGGLEWNAVTVDPADPSHILAANNWSGGIFESKDGGLSWALAEIPWTDMQGWRTIVFASSNPQTVYAGSGAFDSAGTFNNNLNASGIYVSKNGGSNWTPANDSLTQTAQITDLAVHPSDPQVVYAASPANGVYKTIDGGASWRFLQGLPPQVRPLSVAVHPSRPNLVFVGMEFGGLYRSEDGGESWRAIAAGLPPESSITSILFNPIDHNHVYFGDMFSGAYRSTDGGETWLVINDGLRTRAVNELAISSDGLHLYAATEGEGVFRLDLDGQPPSSQESDSPASVIDVTESDQGASPTTKDDTSSAESSGESMAPRPDRTVFTFILIGIGAVVVVAVALLLIMRRRS
jgi:photosystem II stability/assembly factor-like uncharacterized protein